MRTRLSLLTLLCLAPCLSAQFTVEFRGTIEKIARPPLCSLRATHRVHCTNTYLLAGKGVDLKAHEGKTVLIKGSLQLALCPTIMVASVTKTSYTLRITSSGSGQFKLGETVSFRTQGPWLTLMPFVLSGGPTFIPLSTFGALQINPLSALWLETNLAPFGVKTIKMKIPNDKGLIGAKIWSQGIYFTILPKLDGRFLNADCFQIRA